MALGRNYEQILDCLARQLDISASGVEHSCGQGCPFFNHSDCGIIGTSDQISDYQLLLLDPAIPRDKAQPLIEALEEDKKYTAEYEFNDFAPDPFDLWQQVYDLVMEYHK